jgi:hypothetical protein
MSRGWRPLSTAFVVDINSNNDYLGNLIGGLLVLSLLIVVVVVNNDIT